VGLEDVWSSCLDEDFVASCALFLNVPGACLCTLAYTALYHAQKAAGRGFAEAIGQDRTEAATAPGYA